MAAPLRAPYVPLEVYLRSSYEPDAEYVDGVIEERPMGEYDQQRLPLRPWGNRKTPRLSARFGLILRGMAGAFAVAASLRLPC